MKDHDISYFRIVKLFDRRKVTVCSDRTI